MALQYELMVQGVCRGAVSGKLMREVSAMTDGLPGLVGRFGTILADPPWRFANRTGKMAPEHKRLHRYKTMAFKEFLDFPIPQIAAGKSHFYFCCQTELLPWGRQVWDAWGLPIRPNIVWF